MTENKYFLKTEDILAYLEGKDPKVRELMQKGMSKDIIIFSSWYSMAEVYAHIFETCDNDLEAIRIIELVKALPIDTVSLGFEEIMSVAQVKAREKIGLEDAISIITAQRVKAEIYSLVE